VDNNFSNINITLGVLSNLSTTANANLVSAINSITYAVGSSGNVLTSNGNVWLSSALPASGLSYVVASANTAIINNQGILANTALGAFTVTLPASPAVGNQVVVADSYGVFGANAVTIARNGSTIENAAEDLVLDIDGASVQLVYTGNTWDVFATVGGSGGTAVTLDGTQTLTNKTLTAPIITTANLGTPGYLNLTNATIDGTNPAGFKNLPASSEKTTAYNPVVGDVGKLIILGTGGNVTLTANVFSAGDAFSIFNNTANAITCDVQAVTTVYKSGFNTDVSTFDISTRGIATIVFITSTVALVSGSIT
jgi:hypothetical protein